MLSWLRAWTVGVLFVAWLVSELLAAFVPSVRMRTLTATIVAILPWPVTAAIVAWLVAWLPGHFRTAYRNRKEAPVKIDLSGLARYNKFWVAALAAGLETAQIALPLTPLEHGWATVALAMLGALGVAGVPNKPAPDPQPDPQPAPPVPAAPSAPAPPAAS